jgi:multicomponent Na+:H+ antiporter subunit B
VYNRINDNNVYIDEEIEEFMETVIILHLLLVFMIIGSIITIEIKNMLSAVIAIGSVGFILSIAFLFLGAPDIAITQVIVEILSLIILIRSTVNVDNEAIEQKEEHVLSNRTTLIFVGVILVFAWFAFQSLPPFGEPLMRISNFYLANGLQDIGATNFVTSIILDYRAYDTFGEAMVLFVSISGAFAILRRWKREQHKDFLRIDREH